MKAHLHTIVYLPSILTKIDTGRQISVKTQNFTKTLPAEQPLFQDDGRTDGRQMKRCQQPLFGTIFRKRLKLSWKERGCTRQWTSLKSHLILLFSSELGEKITETSKKSLHKSAPGSYRVRQHVLVVEVTSSLCREDKKLFYQKTPNQLPEQNCCLLYLPV